MLGLPQSCGLLETLSRLPISWLANVGLRGSGSPCTGRTFRVSAVEKARKTLQQPAPNTAFERNIAFDLWEFTEPKLFQIKHFSQSASFDKTKLWQWKKRIPRSFDRESNSKLNYGQSHPKCKDSTITVETVKAEQKGVLQADYWQ